MLTDLDGGTVRHCYSTGLRRRLAVGWSVLAAGIVTMIVALVLPADVEPRQVVVGIGTLIGLAGVCYLSSLDARVKAEDEDAGRAR